MIYRVLQEDHVNQGFWTIFVGLERGDIESIESIMEKGMPVGRCSMKSCSASVGYEV